MIDMLIPEKYELIDITECEYIEEKVQTWDIEVDEVHAFTARNTNSQTESVSHNSATICLFSDDDTEMMSAKTGEWFNENPQRARSNNSVKLIRDKTSFPKFLRVFEKQKEWGEPGFFFVDDQDHGTNPCCLTADTLVTTDKGDVRIDELVKDFANYKVLTYNIDTKETEWESITAGSMTRANAAVIELTLADGSTVKLTPDHEVFTENVGFTEALTLNDNDILIQLDKQTQQVNYQRIESFTVIEREDTFDITTEKNHNFFANNLLVHNCEIGLNPYLPKGYEMPDGEVLEEKTSGFQMCNLTTMNGVKIKTFEDFAECAKAAAIIGTAQAGWNDFKYVSRFSKEICRRESLLGVSITGMMDSPDICLNPEIQTKVAGIVKDVNKEIASMIGIPQAARTTCVKPEGSTSLLLNTASGIHPRFAKRYFRRIQANTSDPVYKFFKEQNEHACEPSVYSANKTDDVITFCVNAPEECIVKEEVSALEFLKVVKDTQVNWVMSGNAIPSSSVGCQHNVSNTVIVKADEWDAVAEYIYDNRHYFTGVSMLSDMGDKVYDQAPHESLRDGDDEARWSHLVQDYKAVNFNSMKEDSDVTKLQEVIACAGGACSV